MKDKRIHKFRQIRDLKDMVNQSRELYGECPAFKFKTDKKSELKIKTYNEFFDDVDCLGTKLIEIGLKDKRIAIISENRYEWDVAYLAVVCGTGIVVPLDKSLPENEIESLISRSKVEAIFYSKKYNDIMKKIQDNKNTCLKYFISMDLEEKDNNIYSEKELILQGKKLINEGNNDFLNAAIDNENMEIMLFTSGTTSMSKAVALSHKNICSDIMDIASIIKITPDDCVLSFLPLHHTFECTVGFLYMIYSGASIAFCDGIRHIAENIKEYQITAMISVPILFENMYKRVMKQIEKKGKLKDIKRGILISKILLIFGIDIRKKLFKEIHNTLGGKVRLFVNGAAALDKETEAGFNNLGFKIVQGYGLTETSPVIAAGNDKYTKIGSVGKVLPSVEVKIDQPNEQGIGEIIVKGPNVMIEYCENKEATENAIKNGWFYTGDLGYIDKQNYLFITGRKKDVIVLKNGKNIYPEELEALIGRIDGIKESMVYGKPENGDDTDLKICAKIVYDLDSMKETYNISDEKEVYDIIWKKIKLINKKMPPYKYIREIIVTQEELIKTTTQKVKRHEEIKKILQN